jgi:hypothetical protein
MHIPHNRQPKQITNMKTCPGHVKHTHYHALKLPTLAYFSETHPLNLHDTICNVFCALMHHPLNQFIVLWTVKAHCPNSLELLQLLCMGHFRHNTA